MQELQQRSAGEGKQKAHAVVRCCQMLAEFQPLVEELLGLQESLNKVK